MSLTLALLACSLGGPWGCASSTTSSGEGPLDADPDALVEDAVPRLPFVRAADDDPTNILLVSFELSTTVAEANAVLGDTGELVGGFPGRPGEARALLVLRVDTDSEEEIRELAATLAASPDVALAVPDALLEPSRATAAPQDPVSPSSWKWTMTPRGGTWGHTLTRVPQMWNLAEHAMARGDEVTVGVVDKGFAEQHPDLDYTWDGRVDDHGAMTSGIIGAKWNNAYGIDGVSPHVTLSPYVASSIGEILTDAVPRAIEDGNAVINMSLGYSFIDEETAIDEDDQADALRYGLEFFNMLQAHADPVTGELPFIVASAGNDSTETQFQSARLASPHGAAALEYGAANIIVVEALGKVSGQPWAAQRSWYSNRFGHVSAPGDLILSTSIDNGLFRQESGTSFAAPFVAGLASFVYAMEPDLPRPTLTDNAVLDLIVSNAVEVTGAAPRMDAFATVMDIDRATGRAEVLRSLVDIDDGTLDGNERVDLVTGQPNENDDTDGNERLGDDIVDMADFRRLRDSILLTEGKVEGLDGGDDHVKNDLNQDGFVDAATLEYAPRADFNGDGQLSRSAKAYVPGAIGAEVTDLEVLMAAFEDPDYNASSLPDLIDSGDLHVDLETCFANPDVAEVTLDFERGGSTVREDLVLAGGSHREIHTLPQGAYTVRLQARDDAGDLITESDFVVDLQHPGRDALYNPNCGGSVGDWIVERLDLDSASQLNDAEQVLGFGGGLGAVVLEADRSLTDLDDNEGWRLSPTGPVRRGLITEGITNPDYTCPLQAMNYSAVSPSGVTAGYCWDQGTPWMAWLKTDAETDGPATEVLAAYTHDWYDWSSSTGLDPWTSNQHAINDSGTWVGAAEPDYDVPMLPAILSGSEPEWLAMPAGYDRGQAYAINAGGTMAGMVSNDQGGRALVVWDGGSPRTIPTDDVDDWWGPQLLGDDGTVIGACTVVRCFYLLPPGSTELQPFPTTLDVEEDDGTTSTHAVVIVQDTNAHGQILVIGEPVGTDDRVVLLMTPAP